MLPSGALVPEAKLPKSDSIAILLINTNMKKYTLLPDYIFLSTVIGILRIPIGYRRYPIFLRLVMLVTNPRPPSNFYCSHRVAKRSSKESKFKSLRDKFSELNFLGKFRNWNATHSGSDFKVPLVPPVSTASATSGALVSFGDLFLDNACFYAFVTAPISTISACNRVPPAARRVGHSEQTLFI